jgi:hypothetical protein
MTLIINFDLEDAAIRADTFAVRRGSPTPRQQLGHPLEQRFEHANNSVKAVVLVGTS